LAGDYEWMPQVLAGMHFLVFVIILLKRILDSSLKSA